jgi:Holliday junction resolvase RusA-like endonuclease
VLVKDRRRVSFVVAGKAEPQGSAKAHVPRAWAAAAHAAGRTPRAVVTHDNPKLADWRRLIAAQAQTVPGGVFLGAVVMAITFYLPRPISLPRKIRHHLTTPDLDKVSRGVLDSLTGILYLDDKQVVELHARKLYAAHGEGPRVSIVLEAADPLPDVADVAADASLFADA